jgi:hypothetical protein
MTDSKSTTQNIPALAGKNLPVWIHYKPLIRRQTDWTHGNWWKVHQSATNSNASLNLLLFSSKNQSRKATFVNTLVSNTSDAEETWIISAAWSINRTKSGLCCDINVPTIKPGTPNALPGPPSTWTRLGLTERAGRFRERIDTNGLGCGMYLLENTCKAKISSTSRWTLY